MPASPRELVAAVPNDPLKRFCLVTELAKANNNYLNPEFAAQRRADLALLLRAAKPMPQVEIARRANISRQSVFRLAARALGESRA